LPFIDDWDRHWRRHERVFAYIRDRKPALARKAVLADLQYAETLLRKHAASLTKGGLSSNGQIKRRSANSSRQKR
jgi:DNA-binding GntR family transcriptional regulator